MLRYLLIAAVFSLPLRASLAQSSAPPSPAAAKFESDIATSICKDLDRENQKSAFEQLDKDAAKNVLQQVMVRAFEPRQKEAAKLYKSSSIDQSEAMREVGQRVAMRLGNDCPVALKLFMRMADQPANTAVADTKITDAERPLLTKMAAATCAEITKANAQKPLAQMPKAERMALMQQAMQQVMKANAAEISSQYGPDIFLDADRMRAFGIKLGLLMASQCTTEVASFGAE